MSRLALISVSLIGCQGTFNPVVGGTTGNDTTTTDSGTDGETGDGGGDGDTGSSDTGDDCEPTDEVCDGLDNDCDDEVDNEACETGCVGILREGVPYAFCSEPHTWQESRDLCVNMGMGLTQIEDSDENAWVFVKTNELLSNANPWLGGNDLDEEGVWLWPDGSQFWMGGPDGSPVGDPELYTNWWAGEPNNSSDPGMAIENCMQMRNTDGGVWNDMACDLYALPSVCEGE